MADDAEYHYLTTGLPSNDCQPPCVVGALKNRIATQAQAEVKYLRVG